MAKLQDELTGALIGLARASYHAPGANDHTWRLMIEGLFTTVTNVNFYEKTVMGNDRPECMRKRNGW